MTEQAAPRAEPPPRPLPDNALAQAVLQQIAARSAGDSRRSVSPTEIAQALAAAADGTPREGPPGGTSLKSTGATWQRQMPGLRRAVMALALAGQIEILRKGRPVDPATAKGVIRLRLAAPSTRA